MTLDPIPDRRKAVIVKDVDPEEQWKPFRAPLPPGTHPHDPPHPMALLGRKVPLVDGAFKVSGQAAYTDDLRLPNMLVGKFVHSTQAHARVRAVDATEALAVPGVVAVLSGFDEFGRDITGVPRAPAPTVTEGRGADGATHADGHLGPRVGDRRFGVLPLTKDEAPLPTDKVRYVGDYVALVAAEDEWAAIEAARKVRIDYEPLPAYLDPTKGLKSVPEKIHPDIGIDGSNVQKHVDQEFGDAEAAFRNAPLVVRRKFSFKGVTHAFTEPHAVMAHWHPDGRLTLWSATQVPHYVHRALAEVTGLPMHRIRVVRPNVGGGFGGKSDPFAFEMATALMAMKTRRPVKVLFDRDESFYSGRGRHPTETEMGLAFDDAGRMKGLDIEAVIDGGGFASFGIISTYYNGVLSMGPYKVPAFRYKGRRVYTNHVPSGAMRGHGAVNSRCAMEVLFDEAAERLGYDPIDLRLANLMAPYSHTVNDFRITSNGLRECLERVRAASHWDSTFRQLPLGQGIGVACGFYISGSNLPIHWDIDPKKYPQSTVHLKIDMDAGITVHTGAAEIGQGSDTIAAMVVAEVLGVPMERVRVKSSDSDTAPVDLGSYSSRVTFMMGNAARKAAEEMRDQILRAVAREKDGRFESFVLRDDAAVNLEDPTKSVGFDEAIRIAIAGHGALASTGTFVSTPIGGRFKGATAGLAPAYSMNAYIAKVDVDIETGFWSCKKVWAAHDCGRVLNRLAVEGQIEGSIHMGLGQVLSESLEYNREVLRNPSLLDYKIPTPLEMPEVEVHLVESMDADGPFGAKEAGEGPLLPILPAVLNAIYDAVGVRVCDLPATPDRVLTLIDAKAAGAEQTLRKPAKPTRRIHLPDRAVAARGNGGRPA
ncbi:MAG: xanthine dehydrogenase family protein molybdopterin-binding subunit [Thermoplasmatota archaeon]